MPDAPTPSRSPRLFTVPQRFVYLLAGLTISSALVVHALVAHRSLVVGALQGALVLGATLAGPAAMYVRSDEGGVTVRNLFRTHRIAWSDVRGFSLDDHFPYLAYLDVADGRELALLAIADDPWVTGPVAHDRNIAMVEGLNRLWRNEVIRATTGRVPAPASTPVAPPATVPAPSSASASTPASGLAEPSR